MARVHKFFCFTLFANDLDTASALLAVHWSLNPLVSYALAGLETCPDTDRLHLQGYLQLTKRVSLAKALGVFRTPAWRYKPHMEFQLASDNKKAIDYCRKDGDIKIELGEANLDSPGKRNDLKRVRELVTEGQSVNQMFRGSPELFGTLVRYCSGIDRSIPALQKRPCGGAPHSEWHFGPTGSGKSFWAYGQAPEGEDCYTKDNTKWWDGYDGEEVIVWDDIRGGYGAQFVDILRLLDGRFVRGQVKKGYVAIRPKKIIFTSPISVFEWGSKYAGGEDIRQLRRRLDRIVQYIERDNIVVLKPVPAVAVPGHAPSYNP